MVESHLVWYGFIKDSKYIVWKYHDRKEPNITNALGGTSSMTSTVAANDGGQQPSVGAAAASDNNASRDYITMADLLQDMVDDDGGGNGDPMIDTLRPEDAELLEEIANHLDHDDILFGNLKWLKNFREMKQATIDALYKDGGKCLKQWTALRFNLQLLMCKALHGWTDTSFNDLLRILGDTYPEGNKVPTNTYQVKKLIRLVAMKLKKFHACPNHSILYRGKYENLQSYPHCGMSRYKKNAGCRTDEEGPLRGPKKKKTANKQIPPPEDDEEEGYT
jgi:hypothetical protein